MEKGDSSKEEGHDPIPKNLFWSLVSQVRDSVDMDFGSSCSVVRLILDRLGRNCPSLERIMDDILQQESTNHFDEVENDKGRVRRLPYFVVAGDVDDDDIFGLLEFRQNFEFF